MIRVTEKQMQYIAEDAKKCYSDECCGVLYGAIECDGMKRVRQVQAISNSKETQERYHRFEITPQMMLAAELYARKNGLDIVGFYHSHPDCPAVPSEYDRTHALPVYSYIIVSVMGGRERAVTSWELSIEDMQFYREVMEYDYREEE